MSLSPVHEFNEEMEFHLRYRCYSSADVRKLSWVETRVSRVTVKCGEPCLACVSDGFSGGPTPVFYIVLTDLF